MSLIIYIVPLLLIVNLLVYSMLILFNTTPILIAEGISMRPTIIAGDILILDKPDLSLIKEGDIVAYRSNNDAIVVHRVVEVRGDILITKGDNNMNNDGGSVSRDNYSGRVIYIIPKVGVVVLALRNPLILTIMIVSIVLASLFIYYDRREKRFNRLSN